MWVANPLALGQLNGGERHVGEIPHIPHLSSPRQNQIHTFWLFSTSVDRCGPGSVFSVPYLKSKQNQFSTNSFLRNNFFFTSLKQKVDYSLFVRSISHLSVSEYAMTSTDSNVNMWERKVMASQNAS